MIIDDFYANFVMNESHQDYFDKILSHEIVYSSQWEKSSMQQPKFKWMKFKKNMCWYEDLLSVTFWGIYRYFSQTIPDK